MLRLSRKQALIGLAVAIVLIPLALARPALAQEQRTELPAPGITPDSFWYFGEILKERLSLIFTFDRESKLNKYFDFGNERISEAKEMAGQQHSRETITALDEYISLMKRAEATLKIIDSQRSKNSLEPIQKKVTDQIYYLGQLLAESSDQIVKPKLKEAKVWAKNVQKIILNTGK